MRRTVICAGLGALGWGLFGGCSATSRPVDDTAGAGGAAMTASSDGVTTVASGAGGGGVDPDASCAQFTTQAKQASVTMLFVLDMTASMTGAKWAAAQQAIAAAIDTDAFDDLSLGLVTFPVGTVAGPACILNYPVTCGTSGLAQVVIGPTNHDKSNAPSGVRREIYQYLVNHGPLSAEDDGSPVYDALSSAYSALKLAQTDKRVAVLVTDGGFSCTSLSNRPGYLDLNGCTDWEEPDTMNLLVKGAHDDPQKPVNTFVVGVPGSDSKGQKLGGFDTPPYAMRLALSSYAVSGSPETIDPACSKDVPFTKAGQEPPAPCHIDLSQGSFDAAKLADAIQNIRGKALGCQYNLPDPPAGKSIDPNLVNVLVTLGGKATGIPRRKDPMDDCALDGCWDYGAANEVDLIGKTCADVKVAKDAKVDIEVGCQTVLK